MKILFVFLVSIFGLKSIKGQNFEYVGPVNKELISKMEGYEILLYLNCLEHVGETTDSISWLSVETSKVIKKKIKNYRSFVIQIDSENTQPIIKEYKGKKKLQINKYFLYLKRFNNVSQIQLYQLI